jgi:hypothetical protein
MYAGLLPDTTVDAKELYVLGISYNARVVLSLSYVRNGTNGICVYSDAGWVCAGAPVFRHIPIPY